MLKEGMIVGERYEIISRIGSIGKTPPFCFILPQEKVFGKMHKHARLQTQKNTPEACSFGFMMLAYFSSSSEGSHMEGAS